MDQLCAIFGVTFESAAIFFALSVFGFSFPTLYHHILLRTQYCDLKDHLIILYIERVQLYIPFVWSELSNWRF